ncbi:MAG: RadC family protein [Erysipelotrichaceae bacterium]|jgi:DNA repair protein RadC
MSVKKWDKSIQPREKAISNGIESLSDSELLALIIKSGTRGCSSVQLANRILNETGGINGLMKLSIQQLMQFKGIGLAKAAEITASLELVKRMNYLDMLDKDMVKEPKILIEWLKKHIGGKTQEYFVAVFLNIKNQVIGYTDIYKGSSNSVAINPGEIFSEAIRKGAQKVIIAHNHPSQFIAPSYADDETTCQLYKAGILMNVPLIDHIIVSFDGYYSYAERGKLNY